MRIKLIEMANLPSYKTKLPVNIWIDEIGIKRNNKHMKPMMKVQNDYKSRPSQNTISISIEESPIVLAGKINLKSTDLEEVLKWVSSNRAILLKHWNGEIITDDLQACLYLK